jgi:hypothetical protein
MGAHNKSTGPQLPIQAAVTFWNSQSKSIGKTTLEGKPVGSLRSQDGALPVSIFEKLLLPFFPSFSLVFLLIFLYPFSSFISSSFSSCPFPITETRTY